MASMACSVAAPMTVPRARRQPVDGPGQVSLVPCRAARSSWAKLAKAMMPIRVSGDLVPDELLGGVLRGSEPIRRHVGCAHRTRHIEREDDRRLVDRDVLEIRGRAAPIASAAMAARNRRRHVAVPARSLRDRLADQGDAGVAHGVACACGATATGSRRAATARSTTPRVRVGWRTTSLDQPSEPQHRQDATDEQQQVLTPANSAVTSVSFGSVTVRRSMLL